MSDKRPGQAKSITLFAVLESFLKNTSLWTVFFYPNHDVLPVGTEVNLKFALHRR